MDGVAGRHRRGVRGEGGAMGSTWAEMEQPCLVEHTVVIEDFDDAHKLVAASAAP